MRGFFKPLTKRDAFLGTIIFSCFLLFLVYSIVSELLSGASFDDIRSELLFAVVIAFIDYGLYTVYKGKKKEEQEEQKDPVDKLAGSYADPDPDAPVEIKDEAEVLAGKYEDTEGR